jgi:hypothetical protein
VTEQQNSCIAVLFGLVHHQPMLRNATEAQVQALFEISSAITVH